MTKRAERENEAMLNSEVIASQRKSIQLGDPDLDWAAEQLHRKYLINLNMGHKTGTERANFYWNALKWFQDPENNTTFRKAADDAIRSLLGEVHQMDIQGTGKTMGPNFQHYSKALDKLSSFKKPSR